MSQEEIKAAKARSAQEWLNSQVLDSEDLNKIFKATRSYIFSNMPRAAMVMASLQDNDDPNIQFKAAKEILSLAGLGPQQIALGPVELKITQDQSNKIAEAQRLLGGDQ